MYIEVTALSPRDSFGMMLVTVSVSIKRDTDTTDGGSIDVFIPASDSLAEIRRLAVAAVRRVAQEILDAEPAEHAESEEERSAEIEARAKTAAEKLFPSGSGA